MIAWMYAGQASLVKSILYKKSASGTFCHDLDNALQLRPTKLYVLAYLTESKLMNLMLNELAGNTRTDIRDEVIPADQRLKC